MHWQIEQYVFCDKQQTLEKGDEKRQLEPLVAELLSYFCQHPDQIISRDELIEQVWLGRVVSDNAVNRVVTKLRKVFDDDAKKPRYIATLPKKGYKFIATVKLCEPISFDTVSPDIPIKQSYLSFVSTHINFLTLAPVVGLLILSLFVFDWINARSEQQFQPTLVQVDALTRDAGRESAPRVSPNQAYLTYVERKNQKMHLWIKSLEDQTRVEISHGDASSTWVGPASWNKDGTKVVYLVTTSNSCEYFIRDIDGLDLGEPKLVHRCSNGSYGKIDFLHSDTRFVYTETPRANAPFELFEIDISTGKKRRLPQPELVLGGNSQFDIHPSENKILISSPDEQQWEGFYSLDLDTDRLELLFKQDAFICCGIWDHTGTRVVLMGEHPAFELVSYSLSGGNPQVIYSGIHQLRSPHRHSNGVDYLFVSGHVNQNVHYFSDEKNESSVLINASVDDRLAVFSNTGNQLAYISLSSGNEEVWLSDSAGKQKGKLTRFNDSRHYFDLLWFPDDSSLVGVTLNEIHIIDAITGAYEKLELPQNEYRAASVKGDSIIAFSVKVSGQWRVHFYDIRSGELAIQDEKWQFVRFAPNPQDSLWIDVDGQIFTGPEKSLVPVTTTLEIQETLLSKVINLQKLGEKLVWQQFDNGRYQLFEQIGSDSPKRLFTTDSRHFDLSEGGILYHQVESANADIYATSENQ